jgi:hypothetical protein
VYRCVGAFWLSTSTEPRLIGGQGGGHDTREAEMRAHTEVKDKIGRRFAIVVGVAAAGVMALGAQSATAAPDVGKYDTRLTITHEWAPHAEPILWHGEVRSGARKCEDGRRVVLFKQLPGADRKIGTDRSHFSAPRHDYGSWGVEAPRRGHMYAKVRSEVGDGFACGADRSRTIVNGDLCHEGPSFCRADRSPTIKRSSHPRSLGAQTAAAPDVAKYDTRLTLTNERGFLFHGRVKSDRDRNPGYDPAKAVEECMEGRRVVLFKRRRGADRKVGTDRSHFRPVYGEGHWGYPEFHGGGGVWGGDGMYAKVRPKVRDRYVCRADRSEFHI